MQFSIEKRYRKLFILVSVILILIGGILTYYFIYLYNPEKNINYPSITPIKQNESILDPKILEFGLKIEKIGVLAPIIKDVDGSKKSAYNKALLQGVAHYKGTALPGGNSNIFIFGHSSCLLGKGDYCKIFEKLNDLQKGDKVIVYLKNQEYTYEVSSKKVVKNTDTSVLNPTKQEQLTLMTCWPIGSNLKRLIVVAKKV